MQLTEAWLKTEVHTKESKSNLQLAQDKKKERSAMGLFPVWKIDHMCFYLSIHQQQRGQYVWELSTLWNSTC